MSIQRCPYESCPALLWEEEEKGQEMMDWGLVSLLKAVSCPPNGITMMSHEELARTKRSSAVVLTE